MRSGKKKNVFLLLAPVLLFAAGAGIFLYPAISNLIAESRQQQVIQTYQSQVQQTDSEELERQWQEAVTYNENLAGDPVHDPFVMGSGYVLPENYEQVLNADGDGVMGYIDIPKIDVNLPIYHGTSEEILEKGAGHLESTALPIGSDGGHSVISAHRGLPSAELFTRLDEMEIGDVFYIHVLDHILAYQVDQIEVIEPEELALLSAEEGKDLVTLLTCTPYGVNTHRLLVRGTRIPLEDAESITAPGDGDKGIWRYIYLIVLASAGAALLCVWRVRRRKNRKYRRKNHKRENRRR